MMRYYSPDYVTQDSLGFPAYADPGAASNTVAADRPPPADAAWQYGVGVADTSVQYLMPPQPCRAVSVINSTPGDVAFFTERGDSFLLPPGHSTLPIEGNARFAFQMVAGQTVGSIRAYFWRSRQSYTYTGPSVPGQSVPLGTPNMANGGQLVGTGVTQIVGARAGRAGVLLSNLDATNYVIIGTGAVGLTTGVKLRITDPPLWVPTAFPISGIANAAPAQVGYVELYS